MKWGRKYPPHLLVFEDRHSPIVLCILEIVQEGKLMEMTRISVPLTVNEREALRVLAQRELRDPREQVRYLLQRELKQQGILLTNVNTGTAKVCETTAVTGVSVNP
jgi:hypothetical protein